MKKIYTLLVVVACVATQNLIAQTHSVTWNVNMANETVADTGVYLAGGGEDCFGNPGENAMNDDDDDGIWSLTMEVEEGFSCSYTFTNGACADWSCKENIAGQSCATGEFNDRFLDAVTGDVVINTCFAQCTTDGTCAEVGGPLEVTFRVDMTQQGLAPGDIVYCSGAVIDNWDGSNAMTDEDMDNIWEVTASMPQGVQEYKFHINQWATAEDLSPEDDADCTLTTGEFTNRIVDVSGNEPIVQDIVCFGECISCSGETPTAMVTFSVDMTEVTDVFIAPELNGTFNGWCGSCNPLTDADENGIWETTLELEVGSYEYKFSADDFGIQEELAGIAGGCTITTDGFTNRTLTVSATDVILDTVCWQSCFECGNNVTNQMVTFKVDMSQVTDAYTAPELNGTFNGWCGNCNPLTDAGDGMWELTLELESGSYEYKYSADNWGIQEDLAEVTGGCTLTTDGFTNRTLEVENEDIVIDVVCWMSCEACVVSVLEIENSEVNVYPNPSNSGEITIEYTGSSEVIIINTLGEEVSRISLENGSVSADISHLNSGIYFIKDDLGNNLTELIVIK